LSPPHHPHLHEKSGRAPAFWWPRGREKAVRSL
jgi:hypothetical protein